MVTMKQYETSKADKKADRKGAKKRGLSVKAYERTAADKKQDAKGRHATILEKGGY